MDRMTHEADGLYFLSYSLLERRGAHGKFLHFWRYKHGVIPVPVTQAVLAEMEERCRQEFPRSLLWFLLHRIQDTGKVSIEDYVASFQHWWKLSDQERAKRVMDLLAIRARREGKLP